MRHTHAKAQHRRRRLWNNTKLFLFLCFPYFSLLLIYLILYDKLTYTRILTGCCLWSIDGQSVDDVTTFWRHLRSFTERTYGNTFHFLKLLIFLFHVILVLCRLTTNCLFYFYSIFSLGFNSFDDLLELSIINCRYLLFFCREKQQTNVYSIKTTKRTSFYRSPLLSITWKNITTCLSV